MPPTPESVLLGSRPRSRDRSHGQVAVIFALSIVLFVSLCAVVVDVAFYWVSTLKVQRAADAAALAGAVYLPGDTTTAYAEARASAIQNDYTGGGAVAVTPVQDSSDPRQLDVTITATSPAFFARVVGITSFPVTRTAKGVYVLPVPMGSPLAYYGVGDFTVNKTSTVVTPGLTGNSGARAATQTASTAVWTQNSGTLVTAVSAADGSRAYTTTNAQAQPWSAFGLLTNLAANEAVTSVDGISVTLTNVRLDAACTVSTTNTISVALSGDGGITWTSGSQVTGNLTTSNQTFTFGAPSSMAAWPGQTWNGNAISDGKFVLRLTANKGCPDAGRQLRVDQISSQANYTFTRTTTTTALNTTYGVNDGATLLASQGGWGAVLTKGGDQGNGDAYSPASAVKYDPDGFNYAISLPSGGSVKVYDPGFCAMGSNGVAGSLGAGDHWIGTVGTPVSTYYTLWASNGKLGLPGTWTEKYSSGTMFEDQKGYDTANTNPGVAAPGTSPGAGATPGCTFSGGGADPNHNAWWTIPVAVTGADGPYVLQVQTTRTAHTTGVGADATKNQSTNAENMWSIEAVGGGMPQVYGNGRMTVYNNLQVTAAAQQFYLAKIDQPTGAGKTALIDLFDPGDLCGTCDGTLQVFSPDGGTSHAVNFNYTTDANCSDQTAFGTSPCGTYTNVSSFVTTKGGHQATNNTWIHISIPLPATYGSSGLWQGGWWQIVYTTPGGGNDTTTWEVSVSGNPVHLLVP